MKNFKPELRFILTFIVIIIPALFLYNYFGEGTVLRLLHKPYCLLSALVINTATPGEAVEAHDWLLTSNGTNIVKIGPECDGAAGMLILSAALLAFPRPLRSRFKGILLGVFFLYLVNLVRIIALYYVCKYRPDIFEFSHIYLGQALFIFAGILFFLIWNGQWSVKGEITGGG